MRHGQTADNKSGILSGRHNNTHLAREGLAQAVSAQPLVERLPITHSVCSALERAEITEYLATYNMKVPHLAPNAHFDERDYETDGKPKAPGQEETWQAHQERVITGINELLENPDCVPLVVCHGGSIRRVMDSIGNFQKAPHYLNIPNTGIYEVTTPSGPMAQDWKISLLGLDEKGQITREPVALNAEHFKRKDDEPRRFNA
jgi:broad specificity phosphatase PhoE